MISCRFNMVFASLRRMSCFNACSYQDIFFHFLLSIIMKGTIFVELHLFGLITNTCNKLMNHLGIQNIVTFQNKTLGSAINSECKAH